MKRILFLSFLIGHILIAQSISTAEYFFDEDPGVGNGTTLSVDENSGQLIQNFTITTAGLAEGFHNFHIRTQGTNGTWSLYDKSTIYIKDSDLTSDVVSAEYFFDEDPGVGNGTALSVDENSGQLIQNFTITTAGLAEGFHNFHIRTQVTDGTWSLYDKSTIYIKDSDLTSDVVSAEYFIDSDPGAGNGTSVNITSQTQVINIDPDDALAEGEHLFYIRVLNGNGLWSFYDSAIFTIEGVLGLDNSLFRSTSIYPNPFVNSFTIDLRKNSAIEDIQVFDFKGREVFHSNADLQELDLSPLASGIYILKIRSQEQYASFKIIKE